ncbi:MAG: carboxypeptidase regulatory-like domain-containing protein [Acidobacteriota bacterium]
MKRIAGLFSSVLLLLIVTTVGFAQGTTSRITGVVTDPQGAAVAGATVKLTNEGTAVALTAETSDSGTYTFDLIQVGNYTITIEKQGFKKFLSEHNAVNVNQPSTVNATLEVGNVNELVQVTAAQETVQTSTSGNIGTTIEERELNNLPIVGTRGRNPLDLLNVQPGVVFGGNTGGSVNVHGSRDRAFNFTLDGIDINESTAGGSNFTPLRPNPDSISQVQIVTSNFTAELGRSSGAQVSMVTRSGTNEFHGTAFEFYRTPRLDARSYTANINRAAKDQFVQHIFGGSVGGPIMRNKLFFFTNLQLLRAYDTALVQRTIYTAQARTGLFRYVVGRANAPAGTATAAIDGNGNAILPACTGTPPTNAPCISSYNIATQAPGGLDPALGAIINAMPLPNNFNVGDGLNTAAFNFASPQREKQYDFVTKFDYNLNSNHAIYVRYARGRQNTLGDSANGGRPILPGFPNFVDTFRSPDNTAINWRWSISPRLINEFIFGVSRYAFRFLTPEPDPNLPFSFVNVATPNTNFSYNARGVRTLQYIDNVTYIHGSHTFKGGINFRYNRHTDDRSNVAGSAIEPVVTLGNAGGFTGFNLPAAGSTSINATDLTRLQGALADLLGRVNTISLAFVTPPDSNTAFAPIGTRWINVATYPELDFYFQDNWRLRPNLVLDLGFRMEAKLQPDLATRETLVPNQPVKLGAPPSNTLRWTPGELYENKYVFLPSVGFAWDPFKDGKTSIRGNYRMASDRIATFLFGSSIFQSTPGNNTSVANSAFGQSGGLWRNAGPVIAGLVPSGTPNTLRQPPAISNNSLSVIDPDLQFPQIHQWVFSVQRDLWKNNVFEFNYIGKHAVHLLGGYDANQANIFAGVPGVAENFLAAFNHLRANAANTSPLINRLFTGNAANNAGSGTFRTLVGANLANGNVGTAAVQVSQRLCQAGDVTSGFCPSAGLQLISQTVGNPTLFQAYPQFTGAMNVFDSNDYSNYKGLEVIFRRRMTAGLAYQVAYTWSLSKDNRSWDPSLSTVSRGSVQSASSTPFDINNRNLNYSWSDFDRRHVLQGTWVYELPFGKGRRWANDNSIVDHVIGGWQVSGTLISMSGRPFTVYSGLTTFSNVVQSTANCNNCSRSLGSLVQEGTAATGTRNFWFDAADRALFSAPAPGQLGNTPRNYFVAPVYNQMDLSILKKFRITESVSFDVRADIRNLTNHPSFDNPTAVLTSAIFGRINDSVTNTARRIQLVGKFYF